MEFSRIGNTGIEISRIGLGTWAIGGWMWGGTDEKQSIHTIRSAFDRGINLIDTAPVYGFGRSEEIVGKALAEGLRNKAVIATKVGLDWRGAQPIRDASPRRIFKEIEASLKRLKTDVIDIYQVHWPDPATPIEETADAMATLFKQGKIRAIGVSNFSRSQMIRFTNVAPIHIAQPPYNLFERSIESDILPHCWWYGISTLVYGSICRGLLSGRMNAQTFSQATICAAPTPNFSSRATASTSTQSSVWIDSLARSIGKRVIHLALRWVLDRAGVSAALWGARRPDQLDPIDEVMGWHLTREERSKSSRIRRGGNRDPVGPEFMAPPAKALDLRHDAASSGRIHANG